MIRPNPPILLLAFFAATSAHGQSPIKPIRLEGASKAAAKNNEAIDLYLRGDFKRALTLYDEASLLDFGSSAPWLNGAITNLDLGRLARAGRANQQASLMGDRSIRQNTLTIEIATARGQFGEAWMQVLASEFLHPEDPYVHVARAKLADATSQLRMAERSRWQAYRLGQTPLVDSKPFDSTSYGAGGGLASATDLLARFRQVDGRSALVGGLNLATEDVGGPAHALQSALNGDFSGTTPWGTLMGTYHRLRSDRPGSLVASNLFTATPGARLDLNYWTAGWQQTAGRWTVNANYREAEANLRSTPNAPMLRNSFQTQWMAEGRYDSGPWTAGLGASDVFRDSVANPAIEPLEEVFGQGHTRLAHTYLVHRADLSRSIRLITGGALTSVQDQPHGLLTAELAVKLFGDKYLRFGVKPTMNRVGTNLFPEDLRARSRGGRNGSAGTAPLFSPAGKQLDIYAVAPLVATANTNASLRVFQTDMTHALFASGDPQHVSEMNLTPLLRATVSGVTASAALNSGTSFRTTASLTFQRSNGRYAFMDHEAQVPNVPDFGTSLGFDANVRDWSLAVSANYVGPRVLSSTDQSTNGVPGTRTRQAQGAWIVDAHLSRPMGEGSIMLSALNLTRGSLFPGFGVSSSFRLSYQQRF